MESRDVCKENAVNKISSKSKVCRYSFNRMKLDEQYDEQVTCRQMMCNNVNMLQVYMNDNNSLWCLCTLLIPAMGQSSPRASPQALYRDRWDFGAGIRDRGVCLVSRAS